MFVIKRDGTKQEFDFNKIVNAIEKADRAINNHKTINTETIINYIDIVGDYDMSVEEIQDKVELALMKINPYVAKAFILYREKHKNLRDIKERAEYIERYISDNDNAATGSEVDDNANIQNKNVATLEAEIHKTRNIAISRYRVVKKLKELYGEKAPDYIKDLESHIIYKHDESSAPAIKPYCVAVSLYPFLLKGTSTLDKLYSTAPTNLQAFCGQFNNLVFLLSSQFQGAVAFGEFFNVFYYYCVKDFGEEFWKKEQDIVYKTQNKHRTISDMIEQAFQNIIYSINQPAGNRSYQSPFSNISYYDSNYWHALFDEFVFPDGTKPNWNGVDYLQRKFIHWFNKERSKTLLTFPVETMALLTNGKDVIDQSYKDLTTEMYAAGHSFFTYISDNPNGLSSCCFSKDTKVLWKSSTKGVNLTTLEELHNLNWERDKKNLRIFHNGSWVKGKSIKLEPRKMYKVTTMNNKEYYMTDNHINVTLNGEITTDKLSTNDYLMFNTQVLNAIHENDEHLTYEMGFVVGSFLGDGSFGAEINGSIHDIDFSQNKDKVEECMKNIDLCAEQMAVTTRSRLGSVYNNVYPVHISSKKLVAFIQKWTLWERGTYAYNKKLNLNCLLQSVEFRKGILDGWYNTDGGNSNRCYTTSKELVDCMEALISSLGMNSIINVSDRTDEPVIIRGIEYNRNYPLYCVRWYEPSNHRINKDVNHSWIKRNNSIYFKIKSIEEIEYNDNVYCIECNDINEPYFTLPSGLITHNCRLRNEIDKNEFSFTSGLTGVATGSKSVITLNINRIIQNYFREFINYEDLTQKVVLELWKNPKFKTGFKNNLINILDRVYKYHTAYNELLKDLFKHNMLPVYSEGYINLKQQFLTIGINGINEAALFLGMKCSYNEDYKEFCRMITEIIGEENKKHRTKELKFNCEFVPAESLGIKNYNWDKKDGYIVPEGRNCYTSYFYMPDDSSISVLDKFKMQGKEFTELLDGGVANHVNLEEHLSQNQYEKLINFAIKEGCNYFTFNIPNSQCDNCGFISKHKITECPKCKSNKITWWTRIIGYLRPIKAFSKGRRIEANKRIYNA